MMSAQFEYVIMNVQSECQYNSTITGTNILHLSAADLKSNKEHVTYLWLLFFLLNKIQHCLVACFKNLEKHKI